MGKNRLHILRPDLRHGWVTGRDPDGARMLAGVVRDKGVRLRFDDAGQLVATETEELGDRAGAGAAQWAEAGFGIEKPIRVREFELDGLPVALRHMPYEYLLFQQHTDEFDPAQRAQFAVQIHEWKERHRYVFHWELEFWCDEEGHVTGSRPMVGESDLDPAV